MATPLRRMMARLGFALLRKADASVQWKTDDVPGLFDPAWDGRMIYSFRTGLLTPPGGEDATARGITGFNFSHTCPGDPECL